MIGNVKRLELSSSKKIICIIEKNNFKTYYFFCLNCLKFFRKENKLKSHEKVCKNKVFCGIIMPLKKDNMLTFNQYMKSEKIPHIIYVDVEYLIKKIDGYGRANNLEKCSSTIW